jgi:hypothetical protein
MVFLVILCSNIGMSLRVLNRVFQGWVYRQTRFVEVGFAGSFNTSFLILRSEYGIFIDWVIQVEDLMPRR